MTSNEKAVECNAFDHYPKLPVKMAEHYLAMKNYGLID